MSDDAGLLTMIWSVIRVPAAFSGLAGGVLGAWADGKSGWKAWFTYCGAGFIAGNFFAEPAMHFVPWLNEGGAGCMVGACALVIVRTMIGVTKKWTPQMFNAGDKTP